MAIKVLILSSGNSARSIIAEAIFNKYLTGVETYSAGTKPNSKINPNTIKLLEENRLWNEKYQSKSLNEVININFDLVVTVCDAIPDSCPIYAAPLDIIHIGYANLDKQELSAYKKLLKEMQMELLPIVRLHLGL